MKNEEAGLLAQCSCPGLPGTEDPRIAKAVRAAEKDPVLQAGLARQRALDERQLAALEQISVPPAVLGRLAAAEAPRVRHISGKGALLQPVVLSILIGAAVLLVLGGLTWWNHEHSFTGKEAAMRIVEVNDATTPLDMEVKSGLAGSLNDWFFEKGFEDYYLPPGFENYHTVGARVFRDKETDAPVAQVAIEENNMIFFSFKADDLGVALPASDQWHVFTDGDWVAALTQHEDYCFMATFRGTSDQMEDLLKDKK